MHILTRIHGELSTFLWPGFLLCSIAGFFFVLGASLAAGSEDINADDWARLCLSGGVNQGICVGSVATAVELIETYAHKEPVHRLVCWSPPPPTDDSDGSLAVLHRVAMVAVDYLKANPSFAKMPAPALMLAAFMRQWPCGQFGPL